MCVPIGRVTGQNHGAFRPRPHPLAEGYSGVHGSAVLDVDLVLYGRQLHCLRWEGTLPNLEEEGEEEGITGYHGYVVGERRMGKGCYGYVIHV